jgi:uncharacterized protein YndB with AHSA1/START domain
MKDDNNNKIVVVERTFNAPRTLVWQAWTKSEKLSQWWSPDMFTIPVCELDVRVGGKARIDMKGPDGTIYPSLGEYTEVIELEKLTCVTSTLDAAGNKLFEVRQTAEFTEMGSKTKLTYTSEVISFTKAAEPYLAGMEPGLNQSIEKLEDFLKSEVV